MACLCPLALPAGRAQEPSEGPVPREVLVVEGRAVYRAACVPCHGIRGDGRGPAARSLSPRPRDFTTGVFKFRSTPSGALPTDDDLFRTVSLGVPGTWMPAWDELLSERQRRAVIEYVKTLVPDYQDEFAIEPPLPLPDRTPALGSAWEGRYVFLALKCWECHGTAGRGNGPASGTLEDDWGRRIKPYDFTRGDYKTGGRPVDIYRTLRTGLSGTPMPAFEPGVVLFPGGSDIDLAPYAQAVKPEELAGLREYFVSQPDGEALRNLSDEQRRELAERRLWSLVAYVQSLSRSRGLFYRLFQEDPNLTRPRRMR